MAEPRRPLYSALGISVTCHAAFLLLILFLASFPPEQVDTRTPPIRTELVFLQESGPGGGAAARRPRPHPPGSKFRHRNQQ